MDAGAQKQLIGSRLCRVRVGLSKYARWAKNLRDEQLLALAERIRRIPDDASAMLVSKLARTKE